MHRDYTESSHCSVTYTTLQQLACTHCEEMFKIRSKLNEHMNNDHPDGFENLDQIILDLKIDCLRFEIWKCRECDKIFYSEADVEMNVTRVQKFGEYWNP